MTKPAHTILTVNSVARPKRIAFLVDPLVFSEAYYDALFQHKTEHWGGGYYPIVPLFANRITDDWWQVLHAVDPDVVYSFTELPDDLASEIHRRLAPSHLIELSSQQLARYDGYLRIDSQHTDAPSVHDLPRYLERTSAGAPPWECLYLQEGQETSPSVDFIFRNFGFVYPLAPTEPALESVPHQYIKVESLTPHDFLERIYKYPGRAIVPRDLSTLFAYRPYGFEFNDTSRAFHLVIGDDPQDYIYAWNRTLLSEQGTGRDVLWVSQHWLRDEEFLRFVGKWIARVYWGSDRGRGLVLSHSADESTLSYVATVISQSSHIPFSSVKLQNGQFPFPKYYKRDINITRDATDFGATEQVSITGDSSLLRLPQPLFISGSPVRGGWMVDLEIEYADKERSYVGRPPVWRLPKRAQLGTLFSNTWGMARIVDGGLPSVEWRPGPGLSREPFRLRIPAKLTVLNYLAREIPVHTNTHELTGRFSYLPISYAGKRLEGLSSLFGGTYTAASFLADVYWRRAILLMAAKPDDQVTRDTKRLRERLHKEGYDLPQEVAERVARGVYRPNGASFYESKTKDKLRNLFYQLKNEQKRRSVSYDIGPDESFESIKENELNQLVESGIFLQGCDITCQYCGTTDWISVDSLASTIRCNGCSLTFPLHTSPEWKFRLNSLVQTGLAQEGMLAVLAALNVYGSALHSCIIAIPSVDVYDHYQGHRFSDIDFALIVDSQFVLGEAKSSPAGFDSDTFVKLATIAEGFRPDTIALATIGDAWPASVAEQMAEFATRMSQINVKVRPLLIKW